MHCRLLVIFILVFVMVPSLSFATKAENLFSNPYHHLLEEVADASPLFADPASVKFAVESRDSQDRMLRLRKRVAVARMLLADGQLQAEKKVSYLFARTTASGLIKAGEKWVLMAQAQTDENEGGEEKTPTVQEGQEKPEEKVIIIEKKRRDNRFDIFDDDEFNFYDIIAFPFRLIGMILELLFNILLFPFKLITKILF